MQPEQGQRWDVLCLGEPLVEFMETAPGIYARGFGGDISNVAVAVARSGGSAAIATRLGRDTFGDMFEALWHEERIDTSSVIRDDAAPTGHCFVHRFDASRADVTLVRQGSAASLMRPGDLDAATIARTRVLHLSGITCAISPGAAALAREAVGLARIAGTRVSFDLGLRPAQWSVDEARRIVPAILSQCDIVLPRLDEAVALFGLTDPGAILDRILSYGPQVVALTLPGGGVHLATPEARRQIAPMQVERIDASGSGDTFNGYFLSALTAGDDLIESAVRANAAAAFASTRPGSVAAIPAGPAVDASLRRA